MRSPLIDHCRLDPRRPWPGVGVDPDARTAALSAMSGGGRVVELVDEDVGNGADGLASVCHVTPAAATCAESLPGLLDRARSQVHVGGIVILEEPGRPAEAAPEPLQVRSDRVLLWSCAGGDTHDLRVVRFEAEEGRSARTHVDRFEFVPLDVEHVMASARGVGLVHEGSWGSWSLDTPAATWMVLALRRNG